MTRGQRIYWLSAVMKGHFTAKQTFMVGIVEAPDSKVSRLSNTKGSIKLWQRKILIGLI